MRWKKKKDLSTFTEKAAKDGKVLDKKDTQKVKGGKVRKDHIWNGCGGIIPH